MIWLLACAEPLPPPPPVPEPACPLTYQAVVERQEFQDDALARHTRTEVVFVADGEHITPLRTLHARIDDGLAIAQPDAPSWPTPLPADSSQWTGRVWPHLAMVLDRDQTHVAVPVELGLLSTQTLIPMERSARRTGTTELEGTPTTQSEGVWRGQLHGTGGRRDEDMGRQGTAQWWMDGERVLQAHAQDRTELHRGMVQTVIGDVHVRLIEDCEGPVLEPASVWSPTERMLHRWNDMERALYDGDRDAARDHAARVFSSQVLHAHGTDPVLDALAAFYAHTPARLLLRAWALEFWPRDGLDQWSVTSITGGLVRTRLAIHPVSGNIWSLRLSVDDVDVPPDQLPRLVIDTRRLALSLPPSPDP